MNYPFVVKNIRQELKNYLKESKLQSLVLGISGGIDSTLCALLAAPVCNDLGIELIGRSITIASNKEEEIERARLVGKHFCNDFREIDLTTQFESIRSEINNRRWLEGYTTTDEAETKTRIREGNIKARQRMILLYDLAQYHKGMVLSTDNLTELLLGFWTLHGDVGDYGMIQNLWKTEVYDLVEWFSHQTQEYSPEAIETMKIVIKADATDGLGIYSTDLDQILPDWQERHNNTRSGYQEVDLILQADVDETNPVIQRKRRSEFKRQNPYNIPRKIIDMKAPKFQPKQTCYILENGKIKKCEVLSVDINEEKNEIKYELKSPDALGYMYHQEVCYTKDKLIEKVNNLEL
jgi:NAD+ synthase